MFLSVYVTTANEKEAHRIAKAVISKRLAACANLFPIQSIYRWQGEIVHDSEYAMILKTDDNSFEKLQDVILRMHSYEIPCIVAWPIEQGYPPYLNWISESL